MNKKTAPKSRRRNKNSNSLWRGTWMWTSRERKKWEYQRSLLRRTWCFHHLPNSMQSYFIITFTYYSDSLTVGSIEDSTTYRFFSKRSRLPHARILTHQSRTKYDGIAITAYLFSSSLSLPFCVSVHGIEYNWITKDGINDRSSSEYNIPKRQQLTSKTTN